MAIGSAPIVLPIKSGVGDIDKVHTTPANRAESPEFEHMIDGAGAPRLLVGKASRDRLRGQGKRPLALRTPIKSKIAVLGNMQDRLLSGGILSQSGRTFPCRV